MRYVRIKKSGASASGFISGPRDNVLNLNNAHMKPISLPAPTGFLKIPPGSVLVLSNESPHGISPVSTSPLGASPMRVDSHLKSQLAGASFTGLFSNV